MIELEDYSNALGSVNKKSTNISIAKARRLNTTNASNNGNHVNENGHQLPKSLKNKTNTLDYEQQLNLLNSYKNIKKASCTGSFTALPQTSIQAETLTTTTAPNHTATLHTNNFLQYQRANFDEIMASNNKSSKKSLSHDIHNLKNSNSHSSRRTSQPPPTLTDSASTSSSSKEKSKSETRGKSTSLIKRLSFKFKSNSTDKPDTNHTNTNTSTSNNNQSPLSPQVKQRNGALPPQSPVTRTSFKNLRSLHGRTTSATSEQTSSTLSNGNTSSTLNQFNSKNMSPSSSSSNENTVTCYPKENDTNNNNLSNQAPLLNIESN